jgi:hypothetical protein
MSFFGQGGSSREPSFLRTVVPIMLFTLLCGIVGPIFLVVYFLLDDPLTGWMFYAGLGITIADVVTGYFVAQSLYRRRRKRYNLEQNGRFGIGEVRSVDQTNVRINGQPMMKISLDISGDGIVPFQATKRTVVPFIFMPALRSSRIVVLVDTYSGEFDIDWQRTALLAGTSPARFADTDTGEEFDLTGQADALIEIMKVFAANNIPFGGRVDLRSNPLVREQVVNIARRHGRTDRPAQSASSGRQGVDRPDLSKPAAAQSADGSPTGPPRSPGQRLAELESMRAAGTISLEEYRAVRTRILNDL